LQAGGTNSGWYTGVGFWAKCKTDLQFAFAKAVDAAQDADVDSSIIPSPCSYSANTCNQYGVKNAVITKDWTYYKLYFSELLQDPNGTTFTSGIDKSKLMAFQIHVNPLSPRSGTASANAFDCYIDDVHFLSEAAPTHSFRERHMDNHGQQDHAQRDGIQDPRARAPLDGMGLRGLRHHS
jgi:hypothetical protein